MLRRFRCVQIFLKPTRSNSAVLVSIIVLDLSLLYERKFRTRLDLPSVLDVRFVDVPAGVIQEEGHTGFLHLNSFCGACLDFFREKD